MQIKIEVLKVEQTTKPTQKGSYQMIEVSFKNLDSGKVEAKKLMSFAKGTLGAYKALSNAAPGNTFEVTAEKNAETGYWDWINAVQDAPGSVPAVTSGVKPSAGTTAPKSTYETAEERAKKQVYIVKQSSISAAIAILSVNAGKDKIQVEAVLELAQTLTDFVFGTSAAGPKVEKFNNLDDMDNDIPL